MDETIYVTLKVQFVFCVRSVVQYIITMSCSKLFVYIQFCHWLLTLYTGLRPEECCKLITPYGMSMSWKLKGDNGMVFRIHLKDNFKVWLSARGGRGYFCILIIRGM